LHRPADDLRPPSCPSAEWWRATVDTIKPVGSNNIADLGI
jgi:hypothetical protein